MGERQNSSQACIIMHSPAASSETFRDRLLSVVLVQSVPLLRDSSRLGSELITAVELAVQVEITTLGVPKRRVHLQKVSVSRKKKLS